MEQNQYFATLEEQELVDELIDRKNKFFRHIEKTGTGKEWRKAYDLYYGNHIEGQDGKDLSKVGDDSELTAFGINHYRNLVRHVLALTCSTKPSYDFRAVNSDTKSLQQARLANGIIDSYLVEKRLGRHQKLAAEMALVFKTGFISTTWDPSLGRPYSVEARENDSGEQVEKVIYEGDADISAVTPWRVTYDPALRDWAKNKWVEVDMYENRFDLAARHPEKADEILRYTQCDKESDDILKFREFEYSKEDEKSELLKVSYFYHLPTDAIKRGKFVKRLGDISLYQGPYQYKKKLPVQRITPGEKFDSAEGYTEFRDIMVLQTVINTLYSTSFTNQQAFGVQAVWLPEGCTMSSEQVGQGLMVFKGGLPGTKPEAIQLTATPAEIFKNKDYVEKAMEKLVGINSVVRGDPDHNLKSGVALGRVQAMAIQYMSNFQQSWAELQEDVGTFLLYILQDYAKTERMVAIAGKFNKSAMKAWTGKDIDLVDSVVCDLGNPMFRTYAGRTELADKLYEKGEINGKQYMNVIQTGQIESSLEGQEARYELARKENEMLAEGKPVKPMPGQPHILHAQEHYAVLSDPDLIMRANAGEPEAGQIVEQALAHIMEHKLLHETQEPFWFAVSGEQPPPPQMPPPMEPPAGASADPNMMAPPAPGMAEAPPIPPMPQGPMM